MMTVLSLVGVVDWGVRMASREHFSPFLVVMYTASTVATSGLVLFLHTRQYNNIYIQTTVHIEQIVQYTCKTIVMTK